MKIVAFVPMRHSSERVLGKNYRMFAGHPLYHYIINTLSQCSSITDIYIDTDSAAIIEESKNVFPAIKILLRPENLRDGSISMNNVLANSISQVEADMYLQTHSTNPLLKSDTIEKAIAKLLKHKENDSLFGVTRLQSRLYDSAGKSINHDVNLLLRTQDLPPVYEENSNIYLFTKKSFLKTNNRIGERPILFEISKAESWDIDEEIDFKVAEFVYSLR